MRIFIGFFICCLALLPQHAGAQTWAVYQPEGFGFSVELPGEWKIETNTLNTKQGPVQLYSASVGDAKRWYSAGYSTYPETYVRAVSVTAMLDGARNGSITNTKGTLRSEERIIISNLPARHYIVDVPGNLVYVANILMVGNTLVQAIAVGPQGIEIEPNTIRILKSIKVVK